MPVQVDDQSPLFQFAKYEWDLKDQLSNQNTMISDLQSSNNKKDADIASKDSMISDLGSQVSSLQDSIKEKDSTINILNDQVSDLKNQLSQVNEQLRLALRPPWEVTADKVIAVAMKYYQQHLDSGQTKFPYDFGANPVLDTDGTVKSGTFDCSSFTKQCYKEGAGIVIPRVSKDQATKGIAVDKPRKGDEVFFNTNLDKDSIVDHCGIMIDDDQFIHTNPSGNGINIKRLSDSWGKKYFLFARRIIQE